MMTVLLLWEGSGSRRVREFHSGMIDFPQAVFTHDGGEEKSLDHLLKVSGFFQGQCYRIEFSGTLNLYSW